MFKRGPKTFEVNLSELFLWYGALRVDWVQQHHRKLPHNKVLCLLQIGIPRWSEQPYSLHLVRNQLAFFLRRLLERGVARDGIVVAARFVGGVAQDGLNL